MARSGSHALTLAAMVAAWIIAAIRPAARPRDLASAGDRTDRRGAAARAVEATAVARRGEAAPHHRSRGPQA
jgi:hypothetical protein